MGLDWNPLARPKPGFEAEFMRILGGDLEAMTPAARDEALARFQEISVAPFEALGAPRVGDDPAADAWLREQLRAQGRDPDDAQARAAMQGYYVLDLLPDSPGLPVYTSRGYDGVDRYTFRGAFLEDVVDIIGEELLERAWTTMSAPELADYGRALTEAARRFARLHEVEHVEAQREPPARDDSPEGRAHIVFAAGAWCTWWADRGFGLEPYF